MPLPLPSLDTRRWADLIDEGRALIPRYAPGWTDHNVHDPGITLIELFAWLVEQLMYRANRIPERHRRKFLALTGFLPHPPRPARAVLGFSLTTGTGVLDLPAGLVLHAADDETGAQPFQLVESVTLVEAAIVAVQTFDGSAFIDRSRHAREQLAFHPFGSNPAAEAPPAQSAPALYLGFDRPLPVGRWVQLVIELDDAREGERERLAEEWTATTEACTPLRPTAPCRPCPPKTRPWCDDELAPGDSPLSPLAAATGVPPHHVVRLAWEYFENGSWHLLDPGLNVIDGTRALTLEGAVRLNVPSAMTLVAIGAVSATAYYLRCRMLAGPYDAAPIARRIAVNAAYAEQRYPRWQGFVVDPSASVTPPAVGVRQRLAITMRGSGVIDALAPDQSAADAPDLLVLGFEPPAALTPGSLTTDLAYLAEGRGLPGQHAELDAAPVIDAAVFTIESGGWTPWLPRDDFDASLALDRHVVLDATRGELRFGDGQRGRVPPAGLPVVARWSSTAGAGGNVAPARGWTVADDAINRATLQAAGTTVTAVRAAVAAIANERAASGGGDRETLAHATGRAVAVLWAHERLIDLASPDGTLDQVERALVLHTVVPDRAVTLADYERAALGVPGTCVRRARAWVDFDSRDPCLVAAGTVTVVVVPELPRRRPTPSRGLIAVVRRSLSRRRLVGTRLAVTGPSYLEVRVRTAVRAARGTDPDRLSADVRAALDGFLDPLTGGPAARGWPFGRDVYRSEILAVIDGVAGVDHVVQLELLSPSGAAACGNLCVQPTWLVCPGPHEITVYQ